MFPVQQSSSGQACNQRRDMIYFHFTCGDIKLRKPTVRAQATVTKSDGREADHGGIIQCGMARASTVITMEGSMALRQQVEM